MKEKLSFPFVNKRKTVVKPTIHQNSAISSTFFGKVLKSLIINIDFESRN